MRRSSGASGGRTCSCLPTRTRAVKLRRSASVPPWSTTCRAYRQTLELKCAGLDAKALACRSVPPSDLSLLGLVRHLADVERYWFRQVLAGEDVAAIFRTDDDRDATFSGALPERAVVAEAWAAWRDEMAFAERFVDEAPDLEVTGTLGRGGQDGSVSLREVLVHMIEEYARHCGHADFLRERIDGRIGQ